jgi:hypothetical protein
VVLETKSKDTILVSDPKGAKPVSKNQDRDSASKHVEPSHNDASLKSEPKTWSYITMTVGAASKYSTREVAYFLLLGFYPILLDSMLKSNSVGKVFEQLPLVEQRLMALGLPRPEGK